MFLDFFICHVKNEILKIKKIIILIYFQEIQQFKKQYLPHSQTVLIYKTKHLFLHDNNLFY